MAKRKSTRRTPAEEPEPVVQPNKTPAERAEGLLHGDLDTEELPESLKTARPIVVGIGASAGGLEALSAFFDALAPDTGLVFVVVTHLSPDHKSVLDELLQRHTQMPVRQVLGEQVHIEPDHVYVVPPNRQLVLTDSNLRSAEFDVPRSARAPIDIFFRSLAAVHSEPIAIILSGGGSDGALGIRSVKEAGGLIMVQDPQEAAHDSMPQAAIATGVADVVLPVRGLAQKLVEVNRRRVQVPTDPAKLSPQQQDAMQRILTQLNTRTGHDFRAYKQSTILRRLQRRMQLTGHETLDGYLHAIRQAPDEAKALLDDMLIGVTNFFRDEESWRKVAEDVVPRLFVGRNREDTIRVWSIGCSTGEEGYSLAILLLEHAATLDNPPPIQVFATDLDERSLAKAREGYYPDTIATDVSAERLARFFTHEGSYYRVRPEVRDVVLFATHSVLRDPPFSRLDMVACRNLLIYLQRPLQDNLFELFHYALRPGGFLFLGSSETADSAGDLFLTFDKKHRLYQSREWVGQMRAVPALPLVSSRPRANDTPRPGERRRPTHQTNTRNLYEHMLDEYGPPTAVVDHESNILRLSGTAGRYLQYPDGPPTNNLARLVREELQFELRAGLFQAFERDVATVSPPIPLIVEGEEQRVYVAVRPRLARGEQRLALVSFLEDQSAPTAAEGAEGVTETLTVKQLREEVRHLRERLQATVEEYETSNEELKAANEELQSINEEYRSTTEELETSKEELQSVNEELETVNTELKNKLDEISRAHSDLQNLLTATEIATLFLDRDLRVQRYTAGVEALFNIMHSDRGRPIAHLPHRLVYPGLGEDARLVLRTLVPLEREVRHNDGGWFLARLRPYRTVEDRIEGVVMTFVNITELKQAESEARSSHELLDLALDAADMGWGAWDLSSGRVESDSQARRLLGYAPDEELTIDQWLARIHPDERDSVAAAMRSSHQTGERLEIEYRVLLPDGSERFVRATGAFVDQGDGEAPRWTGLLRDITRRHRNEDAIHRFTETLEARVAARTRELEAANAEVSAARDRFSTLFATSPVPTVIFRPQDGVFLNANPAFLELVNVDGEAIINHTAADIGHDLAALNDQYGLGRELARAGRVTDLEMTFAIGSGEERTVLLSGVPLTLDGSAVFLATLTDITARITAFRRIAVHQCAMYYTNVQLSAARDHFRTLFHASPVPSSILLQEELVYLDVNPAFLDFYGLEPDEVIGRSLLRPVPWLTAETRRHMIDVYRRRANLSAQELHVTLASGETRTVLVSESPLMLDGRACVLASFVDITARKQAEQQMRQLASQLSLAEQAERQRISTILHDDLQQRLYALQVRLASAFAQAARGNLTAATAEVDEMTRALAATLDLTRRLSVDLSPPILEGEGLYHALLWLAGQMKEQVALDVSVRLQTEWRRLEPGLRVALFQIVRELLFNVVKHSGTQTAVVSLAQSVQQVTVTVRDDGVGFDTARLPPPGASGGGLAQARRRVELYGGRLDVNARPGAGTTITLTVPLVDGTYV